MGCFIVWKKWKALGYLFSCLFTFLFSLSALVSRNCSFYCVSLHFRLVGPSKPESLPSMCFVGSAWNLGLKLSLLDFPELSCPFWSHCSQLPWPRTKIHSEQRSALWGPSLSSPLSPRSSAHGSTAAPIWVDKGKLAARETRHTCRVKSQPQQSPNMRAYSLLWTRTQPWLYSTCKIENLHIIAIQMTHRHCQHTYAHARTHSLEFLALL